MTSQPLPLERLLFASHHTLYRLVSRTDAAIHDLVERDQITDELVAHLVSWLRLTAVQHRMLSLVVGISSGVDSAVVAALAKRAFPEASAHRLQGFGLWELDWPSQKRTCAGRWSSQENHFGLERLS